MYIILTEKNMGEISKNLEEGMTSFVSRALENSYITTDEITGI